MTDHNESRSEVREAHINTRTAWRPILKPIARVLIAAQLALVLQPLSALAHEKGERVFNPVADAQVQRLARQGAFRMSTSSNLASSVRLAIEKLRRGFIYVVRNDTSGLLPGFLIFVGLCLVLWIVRGAWQLLH